MARRVLYKLSASPPAVSVIMLADMLAVEMDLRDVDWRTMEHKSHEYIQDEREKKAGRFNFITPLSRSAHIIVFLDESNGNNTVLKDGDFTISESHAILKYMVQKYGGDRQEQLYPSEVQTRAKIDERLFFNAGLFFIRLKVVALPTLLQGLQGPTSQQLSDIEAAYGMVEAYLEGHSFVAANHLTLADLSVGTTAAFMQPILKLDGQKFPRTAAWLARLQSDPGFSKHSAPAVAIFDKTLHAFWEKNKGDK